MNFTRFISFMYLVFSLKLTMNRHSRFVFVSYLTFYGFFLHVSFFTYFFRCLKMPKVNVRKQPNEPTEPAKKQDNPFKKKRKSLTAAKKKELCLKKITSPFLKQKDLANEYDVSEGMVCDILKEKDRWLSIDVNSYQANLKRVKKTPFPLVEEALSIWVENALQTDLIITDSILSTKALGFAFLLGENNFKGSNGWVDNFKKRHNLRQYNIHGEAASAPIENLEEMRENLRQVLGNYSPEDIFNCDETGLFWKMKPCRTISNGQVSGTKQSKDRITVLLTCNATGTEKLAPLLIHKYENPRSIKYIDKKTLPVEYYWNQKSWMQVSIWNEYIKKLNARMRRENRNILLLVDNAPTHALYETTHLTNITIHHLPPNTTSHLQPCDQGIIHSFKVRNVHTLLYFILYLYLIQIQFILVTVSKAISTK